MIIFEIFISEFADWSAGARAKSRRPARLRAFSPICARHLFLDMIQ
ncbi:hypothetical protein [Defluviimonas sp. D31]|nr:hypothetical protein [Defluviimonas sp. D31]